MTVTEQQKNQIYLDYSKKVAGYIYHKTGDSHLAEDLTSEVFLKVYEKLEKFDESKASLSTWIFTIARNRLTDYFRTRKVFSEVPETLEDTSSVEDSVLNAEALDELANALESLDERARRIIILRYYSGKSLKEISEEMDISYAYVKILHTKALASLKNILTI